MTVCCIVEMSLYQITRVCCQALVVTSYVMSRSNRCHLSIQTQTSSLASYPPLSAASILIDKELPVTVTLINIIVSYKTNVYPTPYFDGERGIYANWHKELDIKWNVWWQTLQEQIKNGPLTKKTMQQRYCSCLTSSIIFQKGQITDCRVQMKAHMDIQIPNNAKN